MPEAITKYAVNSSLGTNNFIPLDVLIRNQNVLYASDNLHRMLYAGRGQFNAPANQTTTNLISKFTAINTGTLKIGLKAAKAYSTTYNDVLNVNIKKNGTLINTKSTNLYISSIDSPMPDSYYLYFNNISFKSGDKFEISISAVNSKSSGDYNVLYEDLGIYGDVVPGVFIIE